MFFNYDLGFTARLKLLEAVSEPFESRYGAYELSEARIAAHDLVCVNRRVMSAFMLSEVIRHLEDRHEYVHLRLRERYP